MTSQWLKNKLAGQGQNFYGKAMNLWQRISAYFSGPRSIEGIENHYYLSARDRRAARIERMFARKNLDGRWTVFLEKQRPMLPVGHYARVNIFGQPTGLYNTIRPPQERPEKIATGQTLREAFDRVRRHEEEPQSLRVDLPGRGSRALVLKQVLPETRHYWRQINPEAGF